MEEMLVMTGSSAGSQGNGAVWLFASTGAPAAAPAGGTGHQELALRADVLHRQSPTTPQGGTTGSRWPPRATFGMQEPRE